jgi:hypothetical protein
MPKPYPQEWIYWGDPEPVQENVNKTARDAVDVLDKLGQQWKYPVDFLARQKPPHKLYGEVFPSLPYSLSLIALYIGKINLAKEYLVAAEYTEKEYEKRYKDRVPVVAALRRKLDKLSE